MGNKGIEADKIYEVLKILDAPFAITSVYLVGGCIRDHILGAPIKDYDIAVTLSGHTSYTGFTKWLTRTFDTKVTTTDMTEYALSPDTVPLENYKFKYKGLDIDIIRVMEGTVLEWVNTFPCAASKVYYEFGHVSNDFHAAKDALRTRIFYYEADCPDEYMNRLIRKYPQYAHVYKKGSPITSRVSCSGY